MLKFVSIHLCTDRPQRLGAFYQKVLGLEPAWASDEVIGFVIDNFRLEIMSHSEVSGPNKQPQRLFFDLQVDDVRVEFERLVDLGRRWFRPLMIMPMTRSVLPWRRWPT